MTSKSDFHSLMGTVIQATRSGDTAQVNREMTTLLEMLDDYVDERVEIALRDQQYKGYAAPLYSRH
jgi:hypothetical protein